MPIVSHTLVLGAGCFEVRGANGGPGDGGTFHCVRNGELSRDCCCALGVARLRGEREELRLKAEVCCGRDEGLERRGGAGQRRWCCQCRWCSCRRTPPELRSWVFVLLMLSLDCLECAVQGQAEQKAVRGSPRRTPRSDLIAGMPGGGTMNVEVSGEPVKKFHVGEESRHVCYNCLKNGHARHHVERVPPVELEQDDPVPSRQSHACCVAEGLGSLRHPRAEVVPATGRCRCNEPWRRGSLGAAMSPRWRWVVALVWACADRAGGIPGSGGCGAGCQRGPR